MASDCVTEKSGTSMGGNLPVAVQMAPLPLSAVYRVYSRTSRDCMSLGNAGTKGRSLRRGWNYPPYPQEGTAASPIPAVSQACLTKTVMSLKLRGQSSTAMLESAG